MKKHTAIGAPPIIWCLLFLCLALLAQPLNSQADEASEEKKQCLECHGKKGLVKKFGDGSSIQAYVNSRALDNSVHRSLRCTACHREFTAQQHPNRSFNGKVQYQIKESKVCRDCHTEKSIKSRAVHDALFKKETAGEAVICTNCHSAHAVSHIMSGTVSTSEERYCMGCHVLNNQLVFKNGQFISLRVNVNEIRDSPHMNVTCSDCHFGYSADDHPRKRFRSEREYRLSSSEICRRCHFDKYSKVSESIHYKLINIGRLDAPTCIDCHGGHAMTPPAKDRLSIVNKCKTCHANVYKIYASSIHGRALINKNNKDVPVCIDCHSSHSIKDTALSEFHDYIPDICSKCHSNKEIMGKYGLSTDVVKTYLSDFHGMTLGFYKLESQKHSRIERPMAVCTDCHGVHDIAGMSGVDIGVIKKNLLQRCRTCHESATDNFPGAWLSHHTPSLKIAPMVFLVEQFYKITLPLMVVGLLFYILLQTWRYFTERQGETHPEPKNTSDNNEYIRRFSNFRIVEHILLIGLFAALAATGIVQKFHSLSVSQFVINSLGGIDSTRLIHHITGAIFTIFIIQHILTAFIGIAFKRWEPSMLISLKDIHDALHNVRYYIGLVDRPAMCGRYTYKQKFVYWLVLLGGGQMILTGIVLWFPVAVTKYFSGQIVPFSKVIHTNEAMLIFLLITLWHIYDSVLNPNIFPLDKSIFTWHIKKSRIMEEHPLELMQSMEPSDEEANGPHPEKD